MNKPSPWWKRRWRMWLASFLLTSLLPTSPSLAQVPQLIRYQGQAVDSQGVPLEGPYSLTFRLYDAATAGNLLWQEPQSNITLSKGHFSVLLGQQNPFNVDWSKPCWLSIQVGIQPELTPRQQFTAVPLALRAGTAEQVVDISTRVIHSASSSLGNNTWTTLPFDTETFDTDAMHDPSSTMRHRLIAKTAGKYFIYAAVLFETNPGGVRVLRIIHNDSQNIVQASQPGTSTPDGNCLVISTHWAMSAGDNIYLEAFQNSGAPLSARSPGGVAFPVFGMVKIE